MSIDFTGQTISQYRVKERLKERLCSSLYLAEDRKAKNTVFLEILHVTADEDEDLAGRFRRRMNTVSQLNHPCIAPVLLTSQTDEKRPYAVIEYSQGQFFDTQVTHWQENNDWPQPIFALQIIKSLAEALAAAHPVGLVHHDLRPENILIRPDDTPLLIDLGVPISNTTTKFNIEPGQIYYLDYASPEQQNGQPLIGPSNIFSLGILLYQMLSGSLPPIHISQWSIFEQHMLPKETPLEELQPELSEQTYELVKNCIWRQDWNRYETAQQMLVAIDAAIAAEKAGLQHENSQRPTFKRAYLLYGGIALAVVVIIVVAALLINR